MDKLKISIGRMAKSHKVSTQTLRYYDKIDLFKPLYTDEMTGYRFYGIEQFAHLESILYLKNMGMPLAKIKEYFKNRDLNSMFLLLKKRISFMEDEIIRLEKKKNQIESVIKMVSTYMDKKEMDQCLVKQLSLRQMLFFDFESEHEDVVSEHEFGIKKMEMVLEDIDEMYLNPFASVIDQKMIEKGCFSNFKGVSMVFSNGSPENIKTIPLPASLYATLAFIGTYKEITAHFQKLIDWIRENHYEITGDGIVLIITDKAFSDFEYEYISEIQIPVK